MTAGFPYESRKTFTFVWHYTFAILAPMFTHGCGRKKEKQKVKVAATDIPQLFCSNVFKRKTIFLLVN